MEIIKFCLLILFGYVMGNLSVARIITVLRKDDITKQGSGNPGTMNMLRNQGLTSALITLICDALKAAIPALLGKYALFANSPRLAMIALFVGGFAAVIGHMYPAFYGFRGGKGIACTVGVCFVANPILALIMIVPAFLFLYFVKIGSLTSMVYIIPFALINSFISDIKYNYVAMILLWAIVVLDVFAHRTNFIRLFANEERLTSFKEGVKKDIERVHEKKQERLEDLKDKEKELKEHYDAKLEKKKEKIKLRRAKSIKRLAKKRAKLQNIYNMQIEAIEKESEDVISYAQNRIEKKNQKKLEKEQEIKNEEEVKKEESINDENNSL